MFRKNTTHEDGIATAAIVLVAAVVIGGGVLLATSGNNKDDADMATGTDAMMEEEATSTATFSCANGEELSANFMEDGEAEVTLPDGEVKTVARVEATSGAAYESADGSFSFRTEGEEVTVTQNGETTLSGCTVTSDSSADAEAAASSSADTEADVDTEAQMQTEADTDVETDEAVNVEAEVNAEAEADTEM